MLKHFGPKAEEAATTAGQRLIQQGRREGRQEGRQEERIRLLLRQLSLRFGQLSPETTARASLLTSSTRLTMFGSSIATTRYSPAYESAIVLHVARSGAGAFWLRATAIAIVASVSFFSPKDVSVSDQKLRNESVNAPRGPTRPAHTPPR